MPDRENVLGRIDIARVGDSARTARPFSYSNPCVPFGLLSGSAPQQLQVWVVYASALKNNACVSAFIVQHGF